jgi:hypothetical protein
MFDLVIEIRGGVLVGIYRTGNNVPVAVVDWDEEPLVSPASIARPIQMAEIPIETRQAIAALDANFIDHATAK